MKEWTGVGTPCFAPSRATAPVHSSSSERLPAAMSRCIDAVPLGVTPSSRARVLATASAGNDAPSARATAAISSIPRSTRSRVSGVVSSTPIGARATAPTLPNGTTSMSFIHSATRMKLMLVVPFGSVGAVARAPIGVLLTTPETRDLVERGMEEIAAVARAEGASLPADAVAKTLALLDGVTPSGTASMQRDIAAGKRSELDEWTGAVARLGAKHGVPTPVHSFIYASLLPLEQRARGEIAFD